MLYPFKNNLVLNANHGIKFEEKSVIVWKKSESVVIPNYKTCYRKK
jgi:hypothetical protein